MGRYAAGAAAAAIVAALLVARPWEDVVSPLIEPVPVERAAPTVSAFPVLTPEDGASLSEGDITFSWRSVNEEMAFYQLVVTTEGGDSVWTATTRDTVQILPREANLQPGRTYVWYVDVLRSDGRSLSTGIHHFRLEP
jgi:hypothetical protein